MEPPRLKKAGSEIEPELEFQLIPVSLTELGRRWKGVRA